MSYKVKSLVYLICFIASVLIYGHMESSMEDSAAEEVNLVQTQTDDLLPEADDAL